MLFSGKNREFKQWILSWTGIDSGAKEQLHNELSMNSDVIHFVKNIDSETIVIQTPEDIANTLQAAFDKKILITQDTLQRY